MKKHSSVIAMLLAAIMALTACTPTQTSSDVSSDAASSSISTGDNTDDVSSDITSSDTEVDNTVSDDLLSDAESWVDEEPSDNESTIVPDEEYGDIIFTKLEPANTAWAETLTPTFKWAKLPEGATYTLQIFRYKDDVYRKVREVKGLTENSYTLKESEKLQENELYRWKLIAVYDGVRYAADNGEGGLFVAKFNPKTHPANQGVDYTFKDKVSEEVLNNYLDRILSVQYSDDFDEWQENLRLILYTGAKYISRSNAMTSWRLGEAEMASWEKQKEVIAKAHEYDPELVFEGGIFELVSREIEKYHIPAYVFEDLGFEVEDRNFVFDDMINITDPSLDGNTVFHSPDSGVPDVTRKEAQLYLYFRATTLIDLGMEALHMGIFGYTAREDGKNNYANYAFVLNKIREYAKTHARRGFVFINAHTHGIVQPDGKTLMFDFHAWTMCPISPRDEVAHKVTDDNPQRLVLEKGPLLIYGRSAPSDGTTLMTPSGWECKNGLPYTVELDNAGGSSEDVGKPTYSWNTGLVWGLDEIGWFKIQPRWYRAQWLQYASDRVKEFDDDGHVMMPGCREATTVTMGLSFYRCNNPDWGFSEDGHNDEEAIRNVFVNRQNASKKK